VGAIKRILRQVVNGKFHFLSRSSLFCATGTTMSTFRHFSEPGAARAQ
jgi:hypothetical protein